MSILGVFSPSPQECPMDSKILMMKTTIHSHPITRSLRLLLRKSVMKRLMMTLSQHDALYRLRGFLIRNDRRILLELHNLNPSP